MRHVNSKLLLGIVVIFAFLLGSLTTPAAAYQTQMVHKSYNESFTANANNHTYIYVPYDLNLWYSEAFLHVTEDLDLTRYRYDNTGWASPDTSYAAPRNTHIDWMQYETFTNGPFGNPALLPAFYDFTAADGSVPSVNTTLDRWSFSLAFGQHTPVAVEDVLTYVGALAIGSQEYVHLFISSLQDDVDWEAAVFDPQGRYMGAVGGSDGDIAVLLFHPSGPGTYMVLFGAEIGAGTTALFDFYPQAVAPQEIALNQVVTGILPTGELVLNDESGSVIATEQMPTVHTYKVRSANDVAAVGFAFNYPDGFVPETQLTGIYLTSNDFIHSELNGFRYGEGDYFVDNGDYYYRGGPYYVTVMGGDGTEYSLYNRVRTEGNIPLNREFLRENPYTDSRRYAYGLALEEDSVIRLNGTAAVYNVYIVGTLDDGYRWESTIDYGPTIGASPQYLLPAGDYVVLVTANANTYDEYLELNIGPIQDATSADIERLGGFVVDSSPYTLYNLSVFLGNEDNVTVTSSIIVYDRFGAIVYNGAINLANRWDGSSIQAHPSIANNVTISLLMPGSDEYGMVAICPTNIANNTQGATNHYADYPVEYSIEWVESMSSTYDGMTTLDVETAADHHNFTLGIPGSSAEYYGVQLTASEGTWYNVSIKTNDVTDVEAELYSAYDQRTHHVGSADLDDSEVGTASNMAFQLGAISDDLFLVVRVTRPLAHDGFLYIEVTPFTMNELPEMDPIRAGGGDLLAALGGVAIPVAGGAIVIVVVVVLYFKKAKN